MPVQNTFEAWFNRHRIAPKTHRFLLAVSGGLDSVVLTRLFHSAGYSFGIAHANFQLRGAESDRDEAFVRQLAAAYRAPVWVKKFETAEFAAAQKLSIQAAARELRYAWFRELMTGEEPPLHYLVTAHHASDNVETLLMNFFKGTGIAGLKGIEPVQDGLLRPLLGTSRKELEAFARAEQLEWVEDSSNARDDYTRNYFRHQLIPGLQAVFPEVEANLKANIHRFRETHIIFREAIQQKIKKLVEPKGEEWHIPVLKLKKEAALSTVVYEIMKEKSFLPAQVPGILALLDAESGKYMLSATHRILRHRNWLVITPLAVQQTGHIIIEEGEEETEFPLGRLNILYPAAEAVKITPEPNMAYLDAAAISFPLLARPWKQGDYFYPLGMKKKKKISRFLIDRKLSIAQKEKVWVLESNKKIVWVIGLRIDERVKARGRDTLKIVFSPQPNHS